MLFYAGILLLLCGLFSAEHGKDSANGNLYAMLRSTPGGRGRTFLSKMGVALLFSCLAARLFTTLDVHTVSQMQTLHLPEASLVLFSPFWAIHNFCTVKQSCAVVCVPCALRHPSRTFGRRPFQTVPQRSADALGYDVSHRYADFAVFLWICTIYYVAFLDFFAVTPLMLNSLA